MNKDKKINKKLLKKFLNLVDKGIDIKSFISELPDNQEVLSQYVGIINGLENLKKIRTNNDFEEKSLKDIYLRARIENIEGQKKGFKKDIFLTRLRPAYLKPLVIFLCVFIFISFSFTGTIYASADTVPGELLYTVKRASENVQVALIPYKYENTIYIKMLNSRLNEADTILNQDDFTDILALEKLVTDLNDTYERCRNRNYLDLKQNMQMQIRISTVKEGFKKRYGMKKNNINDFSDQTAEDVQDTANYNTGTQGFAQDNSGSNNNSGAGNNNSSNAGEQNQKGKQNQYEK